MAGTDRKEKHDFCLHMCVGLNKNIMLWLMKSLASKGNVTLLPLTHGHTFELYISLRTGTLCPPYSVTCHGETVVSIN